MKIVKEVLISGLIEDIWPWISDKAVIQAYWEIPASYKPGSIRNEPPHKVSVKTPKLSPSVTTTLELIEKGRRVALKVTIGGWDDIDPDQARLKMPQLALDWERKLSHIKKTVEAGIRKPNHSR